MLIGSPTTKIFCAAFVYKNRDLTSEVQSYPQFNLRNLLSRRKFTKAKISTFMSANINKIKLLNVEYMKKSARIDISDIITIDQLRLLVKNFYGDFIPAPAILLSFQDSRGNIVNELEEIPDDYKNKEGPSISIFIESDDVNYVQQSTPFDASRTQTQNTLAPLNLAPFKIVDSLELYELISSNLTKLKLNLQCKWDPNNLLTWRLGVKLSDWQPSQQMNIKLMVGVSGCGKTRRILELLFHNFGLYFTAQTSQELGSTDLQACRTLVESNPKYHDVYIQNLLSIRLTIVKILREQYKASPEQVLFAQLYPIEVFGEDIYSMLFNSLQDCKLYSTDDTSLIVAVDEIQESLYGQQVLYEGFSQARPFISPLILGLRSFYKTFIVSGTHIKYSLLQELIRGSYSFKFSKYDIEDVDDFQFVDEKYAVQYIDYVMSGREEFSDFIEPLENTLPQFNLCHGRVRLLARILESILKQQPRVILRNKQSQIQHRINSAINQFMDLLRVPQNLFKFILQKDWETIIIDRYTLFTLLQEAVISLLIKGNFEITLSNDYSADVVNYGLGFREVVSVSRNEFLVRFFEPCVLWSLQYLLSVEDCVCILLKRLREQPDASTTGKWFEYLVAYAVALKFSSEKGSPKLSRLPLSQYICQPNNNNEYVMSVNQCGPDIFFKSPTDNTLYIIQVKLKKKFYKNDQLKATNSVKSEYFYCNRQTGGVLNGWQEERNSIINAISNYDGKIKRIVVAHAKTCDPSSENDVIFVTNLNDQIGIFSALSQHYGSQADDCKSVIWNAVESLVRKWEQDNDLNQYEY